MSGAPRAEQAAFLHAHPDLYHHADGVVRLTIRGGRVALGSLSCEGFTHDSSPWLKASGAVMGGPAPRPCW